MGSLMRMYNSRKSASLIEPAQSPFEKEGTEPVSVFCESDYAEVEDVLLFAEDKKIKDPSIGNRFRGDAKRAPSAGYDKRGARFDV